MEASTMKNKILLLFAHPRYERSKANITLLRHLPRHSGITFHDLYEKYPEFNVQVSVEKKLLLNHQIIIWHHPFYWYSAPPLLKQWIDMVLEYGWAYGPGGNALQGKLILNAITSGGQQEAYSPQGHHRFTVRQLLAPFEQTARLCNMTYLPPFVVHGTHQQTTEGLQAAAEQYKTLLELMNEGSFSVEDIQGFAYINEWLNYQQTLL
jgi:glutathione-regulated potassium-efflux system ancillary protein KefG